MRIFAFAGTAAVLAAGCGRNCARPGNGGASGNASARVMPPLEAVAPGLPPPVDMANAKTETFVPRWEGNDIVAGSKRLSLQQSSAMTLTESGETLFKMGYGCRGKSKVTGKTYWPAMTYHFVESGGTMRREGNALVHKRPYRLEEYQWNDAFVQRVELLPDGLVAIDVTWTEPGNENLETSPIGASWTIPYQIANGCKYAVNGSPEEFTPGPNKHGRSWKADGKGLLEYSFFTGHAARQFKILARADETGGAGQMFSLDGGMNFRVLEHEKGPRRRGYRIYLDMRKGVGAQSGEDIRAGVDFRAVENMGMPQTGTRNLLPNPSFERGMFGLHRRGDIGSGYYPERSRLPVWTADGTEHWHGARSLKILAWAKGGTDYRNLDTTGGIATHEVPCEAGPHTISFYAKGNRPGNLRVAMWVGNFSTGSNYSPVTGYNKRLIIFPDGEWKRYTYTYDIPVSMPVAIRFTVNSVKDPCDGAVWIDAVQLEKGSEATAFVPPPAEAELITSSPDDFISAKSPISARLAVSAAPGAKGSARVRVRDFFGAERFDRTFPFAADAAGHAEIAPDFDGAGLGLGVFAIETDYELSDGSKAKEFDRFAVCDWLENKHPRRFLCADDYGTLASRENVLHQLERWRKVGIGMKSGTGRAEFPEVHELYRTNGIPVSQTIWVTRYTDTNGVKRWCCQLKRRRGSNFTNEAARPETLFSDPWLDPDCPDNVPTEKYLAKVRAAGEKIAREYPFIDNWQFGSEFFGTYPIEYWSKDCDEKKAHMNHARILKAFGEGIKSVSPRKTYAGDDPWNMNHGQGIKEVEMTLSAAKELGWKFDLVTCHSYRNRPESPDLDADLTEMMAVLERLDYKDVPFELPEGMHWGPYEIPQWGTVSASWGATPVTWGNGPLSYDIGWTEKTSAGWFARSWIIALKHNVHSYCSGMVNGGNFALETDRLTPRAAQLVANVIGHQLGYAKGMIADVRFAPLMRAYVFDDGFGRPVAAVWGCDPEVDAGRKASPVAQADLGGLLESVTDIMNNPRKFVRQGAFAFPLSPFPVFLRGKPGTAAAFTAALRSAKIISGDTGPAVVLSATLKDASTVEARVRNLLGIRMDGTLNGRRISVAPLSEAVEKTALAVPADASAVRRYQFPMVFEPAGSEKTGSDMSFYATVVQKTAYGGDNPAKVDWSRHPKLPLRPWGETPAGYGGSAQIAWNASGIFLRVEVADANFVHEEFAAEALRNGNDCLQIGFDGYGDARWSPLDGIGQDDYEYAVFPPGKNGGAAVLWANRVADRQITANDREHGNCRINGLRPQFSRKNGTSEYLVFFPKRRIYPGTVAPGAVVSMGITVFNADDPSAKGAGRVKGGLSLTDGNTTGRPKLWAQAILGE